MATRLCASQIGSFVPGTGTAVLTDFFTESLLSIYGTLGESAHQTMSMSTPTASIPQTLIERKSDYIPEHKLLLAVLERAARDAFSSHLSPPFHEQLRIRDWRNRLFKRRTLNWFESDSTQPFSFLWICEHLEFDIKWTKSMLKRMFSDASR